MIILLMLPFWGWAQGQAQRSEMNLNQVYSQFGLSGDGSLVVILDRGIDYRHPDFIDANGNTRIAYIFDLIDDSGANAPNNSYGAGTIYDAAQINNALDNPGTILSIDRGGHGTATTGIAAGDGSGTNDEAFQGVAPGATIISIKVTHDGFPAFGGQAGQAGAFDPNDIPIALDFAADKIAELNMPSVTLMNLGSIGGPTDGTSTVSRAIDDYVSLGNTFVCGVGDDGGQDNYAAGTVGAGLSESIEINKGEVSFLRMDLWYSETDRFTVSIERPDGTVNGPFLAPSNANGVGDVNLGDIFIGHRGANVEFFGATSNRRELLIDFTGSPGVYKIILEGATINDGGFQATLNPSTFGNNNRFITHVVAGHSVNDYASANLNITPTDYVIQNTWTDVNGIARGISGQGNIGEIWIGSSAGPTHDDRMGVDFATPGEVCFTAYAPDTYYSNFSFNQVQNGGGLYGIQNAVSAAAPIATGVIALMLEVKPDLTPAEVKSILQNSCKTDAFTGSVPNETWGFGKLDALLAIQNTQLLVGIEEVGLADERFRVFPNPASDQLFVDVLDSNIKLESVQLYNALGQVVYQSNGSLLANQVINLKSMESGLLTLVLDTPSGRFSKRILHLGN